MVFADVDLTENLLQTLLLQQALRRRQGRQNGLLSRPMFVLRTIACHQQELIKWVCAALLKDSVTVTCVPRRSTLSLAAAHFRESRSTPPSLFSSSCSSSACYCSIHSNHHHISHLDQQSDTDRDTVVRADYTGCDDLGADGGVFVKSWRQDS